MNRRLDVATREPSTSADMRPLLSQIAPLIKEDKRDEFFALIGSMLTPRAAWMLLSEALEVPIDMNGFDEQMLKSRRRKRFVCRSTRLNRERQGKALCQFVQVANKKLPRNENETDREYRVRELEHQIDRTHLFKRSGLAKELKLWVDWWIQCYKRELAEARWDLRFERREV